jgi:putative peptide zinc metalloprotease protein
MTAVDNRPGATGGDARGATRDGDPLVRPDGVVLLGEQHGSGYVVPPALVRRGDGQVLQLTPLLYAVLDAVDGTRDVEEVARVASERSGRRLAADDVRTLVDGKLRPLGLVCAPDGSVPPLRKLDPLLRLRPRYVVSDPHRTRRLTEPFTLLFNPVVVAVVTVAFAVVAFWVLFDKGLASAAYQAFASPGLLLTVFAVTVVSAGFHEFGHAAALRRGGGTPGAMGAGLYLVWPAFFTDVTDAYRLDRRARIRTDLGGLYFNALVAVATYALWWVVRWDALLLVVATQILQMLRQLPPLVRFDGYHLLADVTGVPDLFHRIGPTLRGFLPGRRRGTEPPALKRWVRVVVAAWVLVVVPILLLATVLAVVALPRLLATTVHSIDVQGRALVSYATDADVPGTLVKALAIVALLVPAGGTVYMLARAVRRYGTAIWRRTRGKPRQRAVAGVAAAAVLAALAYAWWPHGNYRPIQPYERGTVQDALPVAGTTLLAGHQLSARTVWPNGAGALPTAAHPTLAVVLAPRTGDGPTWVFPFDRPAPPGPGDNQAMAIVTKDGGTAYDVAFALVWVDSDTVLNRNEAYAFASCRDCRAVAVSFQVVLVVGHADVVAPQNVSAAVAYDCIRCVTQALAVQLVVTVPDRLSGSAMHQLMLLWRQIRAFGAHLRGLTFAQIRARIVAYERQILAIVRPDLTTTAPPTPTSTPPAVVSSTPNGSVTPVPSTVSSSGAPVASAPSGTATTAAPSVSPSDVQSTTTAPAPATTSGTPTPAASP